MKTVIADMEKNLHEVFLTKSTYLGSSGFQSPLGDVLASCSYTSSWNSVRFSSRCRIVLKDTSDTRNPMYVSHVAIQTELHLQMESWIYSK